MPDESSTAPLVMLGDPAAAVCDGDVCYLPSATTAPGRGPVEAGPDGDEPDRTSEAEP